MDSGRIQLSRSLIPDWLSAANEARDVYCVPLARRTPLGLPMGRELEAWYLWSAASKGVDWLIDPVGVLAGTEQPNFPLRSLMYPARLDGKSRLCCPDLFNAISAMSERTLWIAPDPQSVTIWTNFAFQAWYGRLGLS